MILDVKRHCPHTCKHCASLYQPGGENILASTLKSSSFQVSLLFSLVLA